MELKTLTINGKTYDSFPGAEMQLINTITVTEEVETLLISTDSDGNSFELEEYFLICDEQPYNSAAGNVYIRHNGAASYQFTNYNFLKQEATTNSTRTIHGLRRFDEFWDWTVIGNSGAVAKPVPIAFGKVNSIEIRGASILGGRFRLFGR